MSIDDSQAEPWGTFSLNGHDFTCRLPASFDEPQVWTILVEKSGEVVRRETIPLDYPSTWGPDTCDVNQLNERIEEIIKELRLE